MADVQPFKALHYDLDAVGSLDAVAAPPYDVIDAAGRAALLARSPYNAVAIDLPKPFDPADPASTPDGDPYEGAARTIDAWRADGALVADEEPSIWALAQDYTAPTAPVTAATGSSPGCGWSSTTKACARTSAPTPARCWTGWS